MKVAFTSSTGAIVDGNFCKSNSFSVWDIGPYEACYITTVSLKAEAGSEDDLIAARAEALKGCAIVCAKQIKGPAAAKLVARKIHPMKTGGSIAIEEIIGKLQDVLRGSPAPWIRKALMKDSSMPIAVIKMAIEGGIGHSMRNNVDNTSTGALYLLRHGDSRLDGVERFVGQSDLSLNSEGRSQALNWEKEFADIPLKRIFCSDLSCSLETASIIAGGRSESVQPLSKLREINMGAWDGQPINDIRRLCPVEYEKRGRDMVYYRPPAGECFADVAARVIPLFEEIVRGVSGNVMIVGHEGVNKVLLCHILGMPLENMLRLRQDYGCLNVVECGRDEMRLVNINIDSMEGVQPLAAERFRRAEARPSLSSRASCITPSIGY